jgi:azurin
MHPLRSVAAPLLLTLALGGSAAAQTRTVELVATDNMRFSAGTIEARAGESLRVVVRSTGQMPKIAMAHNFVLLQPGTDPGSFANEGAMHRGADFIAPGLAGRVIAKTPMAGAGETVEVTVTAPGPGSYPFVCTFPGHAVAGMTGTLVVQ